MSLTLAPKIEAALRQYAEQAGVSVDELLEHTFPMTSSEPKPTIRFAGDSSVSYSTRTRYGKKGRGGTSELCAEWDAEDR